MKRILMIPAGVLLILLLCCAYLYWEIQGTAHLDQRHRADAIVVLGAAEYNGRPSPVLRRRLLHALDLYRLHLAPWMITTGGGGGDWRFTEAGVGAGFLQHNGVPAQAVLVEPLGFSTADSVRRVAALMRSHQLRSCLVVSDGYHLFRARQLFRAQHITVYTSPVPGPTPAATEFVMTLRQMLSYILWKLGFQV